ncbi:MAG: metal-dependent hydrolase, partial [Pseudonocardia sp.]|nr:metal-dependent hydrolase [Pseudonocardia sp.]
AINLASAHWGTPVLIGTLFVCLALAIKGLDAIVPGPPSLVVAAGLTFAVEQYVPGGTAGTAGWLGSAVTLGMIVHSVGDASTESGAPLLWPVPIRQRRWYPVGSPRPKRFRTGGRVEAWLVAPALTVATFVLAMLVVPGVAPAILSLRDAMMGT